IGTTSPIALWGKPFEKFPIKFGYLCSSPLVVSTGTEMFVSARAACTRFWYESRTRFTLLLSRLPGGSGFASAEDPKETAPDARVTAAAPRSPVRNSLRVAKFSSEEQATGCGHEGWLLILILRIVS